MTRAKDIQELVRRHLTDEVACDALPSDDGRVGCVVPLDYPSGDSVSVWIELRGDRFLITDYGEALADAFSRPPQDHHALIERASHIARLNGVNLTDERLSGDAEERTLGEMIWRVAATAAHVALVSSAFKARKHPKTKAFAAEVARDFKQHDLAVERERKLEGASGHEHRVSIYLPATHAIMEPVGGGGNWTQVSTVYTRLNDVAQANGYTPYTLVDDREQPLEDDLAAMLTQVCDVLEWSHRDDWIDSL